MLWSSVECDREHWLKATYISHSIPLSKTFMVDDISNVYFLSLYLWFSPRSDLDFITFFEIQEDVHDALTDVNAVRCRQIVGMCQNR